MAQFPKDQMGIIELAEAIIQGLTAYASLFPNPPVSPAQLTTEMLLTISAHDDAVVKAAETEQATTLKNERLGTLSHSMRTVLRYCEVTVDYDDDKLKLLGWAGRAEPTPLEKPGPCTGLKATAEGDGWIALAWTPPETGGKVADYRVMRRKHGAFAWSVVEVAYDPEARLEDQEQGKTWDYCVIASNKAGQSGESNVLTAVL